MPVRRKTRSTSSGADYLQPGPGFLRPGIGRQDRANACGIEKGEAPQVENEKLRAELVNPAELLVEATSRGDVELSGRRHGDHVAVSVGLYLQWLHQQAF